MSPIRTAPQRGHYKLSKKLLAAIDARFSGATLEDAARQAGMSLSGFRSALLRGNVQAMIAERFPKELALANMGVPAALHSALEGSNAAAKVAAAKTLLDATMPRSPLVNVNVGDPRGYIIDLRGYDLPDSEASRFPSNPAPIPDANGMVPGFLTGPLPPTIEAQAEPAKPEAPGDIFEE